MGLFRIIILGMLFYLARTLFHKFQQNRINQSVEKRSGTDKKVESRKTLRCDHCGVYIPANEALWDAEKVYCCPEHKEHGQSDQ